MTTCIMLTAQNLNRSCCCFFIYFFIYIYILWWLLHQTLYKRCLLSVLLYLYVFDSLYWVVCLCTTAVTWESPPGDKWSLDVCVALTLSYHSWPVSYNPSLSLDSLSHLPVRAQPASCCPSDTDTPLNRSFLMFMTFFDWLFLMIKKITIKYKNKI